MNHANTLHPAAEVNHLNAGMPHAESFQFFQSSDFRQIEADFARYNAQATAIAQHMDALSKQREALIQKEQEVAIPEIRAWIAALRITPEQLGYAPLAKKSTGPSIPKYRNPETGDTHSGKGSCPGWLTKEAKNDLRYRNPEWTAKDEAKNATTESPSVYVADQAPASNDAPTTTNGGESLVIDGSAAMAVTNVAAVDVTNAGSNALNAPIVSPIN